MHLPTVMIGAAAILYGIYTMWARIKNPHQFAKLEAMKQQWGSAGGNAIHIIAYTLVPVVAGVIFLVMGLQGRSMF